MRSMASLLIPSANRKLSSFSCNVWLSFGVFCWAKTRRKVDHLKVWQRVSPTFKKFVAVVGKLWEDFLWRKIFFLNCPFFKTFFGGKWWRRFQNLSSSKGRKFENTKLWGSELGKREFKSISSLLNNLSIKCDNTCEVAFGDQNKKQKESHGKKLRENMNLAKFLYKHLCY